MVVTGRGFPLYAFAYCRYILAHYKARDRETNGRACGYVLKYIFLSLSLFSVHSEAGLCGGGHWAWCVGCAREIYEVGAYKTMLAWCELRSP